MRWLLCECGKFPGEYYRLPEGEKAIIRAMYHKTMEERQV